VTSAPGPGHRRRLTRLERVQRDPDFLSQAGATVLLGSDFVIRAATPAYTAVTRRHLDDLLTRNVFDAFPDNPQTPDEHSTVKLAASVDEVFRSGKAQRMPPLRYDIPDPRRSGRFIEKRWMVVAKPVILDDEVIGTSVRGYDLTSADDSLVRQITRYRNLVVAGGNGAAAAGSLFDACLALVEQNLDLFAEASGLERALATRPTIDQAKGIIMAERRCGADEAFDVLRRFSQDSNVPLAEVAAAIVYHVQSADRPAGSSPGDA